MAQSYLGIITRRGLESLIPETEHAAPFLLRRIRRCRDTLCCWAVLADATAAELDVLVNLGCYLEALQKLNCEASDLGRLTDAQA